MNKPSRAGASGNCVFASQIMKDPSNLGQHPEDDYQVCSFSVDEGIEMLLWRGCFRRALEMSMRYDQRWIQFSYSLQGRGEFEIEGLTRGGEQRIHDGAGFVLYPMGRIGHFSHQGAFAGLSFFVQPDVFVKISGQDAELSRCVEGQDNFVRACRSRDGMELQRMARALHAQGFGTETPMRYRRLWLQGQSMSFMALMLEGCEPPQEQALSGGDRRKLLRARDILLADLSRAPALASLAEQSELGLVKLKKGFRCLFGTSVYGLYLRERMHEARRRIEKGETSVTTVAMDLGYSNVSHFAAAFRKQFGINPAQLKWSEHIRGRSPGG